MNLTIFTNCQTTQARCVFPENYILMAVKGCLFLLILAFIANISFVQINAEKYEDGGVKYDGEYEKIDKYENQRGEYEKRKEYHSKDDFERKGKYHENDFKKTGEEYYKKEKNDKNQMRKNEKYGDEYKKIDKSKHFDKNNHIRDKNVDFSIEDDGHERDIDEYKKFDKENKYKNNENYKKKENKYNGDGYKKYSDDKYGNHNEKNKKYERDNKKYYKKEKYFDSSNQDGALQNRRTENDNMENENEMYRKYDWKDYQKDEDRKYEKKDNYFIESEDEDCKKKECYSPSLSMTSALLARFMVHTVDWVSVSTSSSLPSISGSPFANVVAMSDGSDGNSRGIPYFYMTSTDLTAKDIEADNRCTATISLQPSNYCSEHNIVPEDPRCATLVISGNMIKVDSFSKDYEFVKKSFLSHHSSLANLLEDHSILFTKMNMKQMALLNGLGGIQYIPIKDYLAIKTPETKSFLNDYKIEEKNHVVKLNEMFKM